MTWSNSALLPGQFVDVRDFSTDRGGARGFLERSGIVPTARNPRSTIVPSLLTLHTEPLKPPYPNPEDVGFRMGEPAPDRAETTEWPYTEEELS